MECTNREAPCGLPGLCFSGERRERYTFMMSFSFSGVIRFPT